MRSATLSVQPAERRALLCPTERSLRSPWRRWRRPGSTRWTNPMTLKRACPVIEPPLGPQHSAFLLLILNFPACWGIADSRCSPWIHWSPEVQLDRSPGTTRCRGRLVESADRRRTYWRLDSRDESWLMVTEPCTGARLGEQTTSGAAHHHSSKYHINQ